MIRFKLDLFNITKYFQYNIRFDSRHSKYFFPSKIVYTDHLNFTKDKGGMIERKKEKGRKEKRRRRKKGEA